MQKCQNCHIATEHLRRFVRDEKDKKGDKNDDTLLCSRCYDWYYSRTTSEGQYFEFIGFLLGMFIVYALPVVLSVMLIVHVIKLLFK